MDDLNNVSKETAWQLGYIKGCSDAVRHGKWLYEKNGDRYCSVCGGRAALTDRGQHRVTNNFCRWCGAKMDLEG